MHSCEHVYVCRCVFFACLSMEMHLWDTEWEEKDLRARELGSNFLSDKTMTSQRVSSAFARNRFSQCSGLMMTEPHQ